MNHLRQRIKNAMPDRVYLHMQAFDHLFRGEPEIRLLGRLCDPDRLSIDIGANIGTYTYFMRKYSRAVVAYEPNPILAAKLAKLFPAVDVRAAAVSDHTGQAILHIPVIESRRMHELASLERSTIKGEGVSVPVVRLDNQGHSDVGFIKIDVERHEMAVLAGARKIIERDRPVILTEVSPLLYPKPLPVMFDWLLDLGYTGWFSFNGRRLPFSAFDAEKHANRATYPHSFMHNNVLFMPKGRKLDG